MMDRAVDEVVIQVKREPIPPDTLLLTLHHAHGNQGCSQDEAEIGPFSRLCMAYPVQPPLPLFPTQRKSVPEPHCFEDVQTPASAARQRPNAAHLEYKQ